MPARLPCSWPDGRKQAKVATNDPLPVAAARSCGDRECLASRFQFARAVRIGSAHSTHWPDSPPGGGSQR